jgi:WD40 repeat protein
VTFAPDGKLIALAFGDIRLWSPETGKIAAVLPKGGGGMPLFSADGRTVVSSNEDGSVRIWELPKPEP